MSSNWSISTGLPWSLLEAFSLQFLHDDEGMAIVVFDFMDGADARMIQLRGSAGLSLKALHGLLVASQIIGKKLHGDPPAQAGIFRL